MEGNEEKKGKLKEKRRKKKDRRALQVVNY